MERKELLEQKNGHSVLVVDDEPIVRDSLRDGLGSFGYKIEVAEDGQTALQKLKEGNFSLVILDLRLPGQDSTEVLKQAREANPDLKAIIATAYPHMAESLQEAADWIFFKPVSFSQLRDLAARFGLEKSRRESNDRSE